MADLSSQAFVEKWEKSKLSERSASQPHFLGLCRMLGQPPPADLDRAVFAAYGWPEEIGNEEILENLLALNLERSS